MVREGSLRQSNEREFEKVVYVLRNPYRSVVVNRFSGCEVDVVLLNDAGVQRVEIHDQDELVPKAALRFEDQATLVLVSFRFCVLVFLLYDVVCIRSAPALIRADVLQTMELVK